MSLLSVSIFLPNGGFEVNSPSNPRDPESFKIFCFASDLVHKKNVNLELWEHLLMLIPHNFSDQSISGSTLDGVSSLTGCVNLITASVWM